MFSLFSCKQEEVMLPKSDVSVMSDLQDHSPIYFFFRTEENDTLAELNQNNKIGTTNWIFNIDKRLPLHTIIPEIAKLQQKKKDGMHKKEGTINVYSYADTLHQNLAFLPFTDVKYYFDQDFSKFFIKKNAEAYMNFDNFTINFKKDNTITVDGNDVNSEELPLFISEYADFLSDGKPIILHLNFDKHLTYGQYLEYKLMMWKMTTERISISSYEFIYDVAKIPDCNCKL